MGKKTTAAWFAATWMALFAPAWAVDPALHQHPAFSAGSPLDAAAMPGASFDGVEVREIRDLGARRDAQAGAQDLWQRMRGGFALAPLDSPIVVERQAWYAQRPQQLRIMAERSRRYLFHIVEEVEKRGMPTELALLPMVESAFNPLAYSPAHASGLWQFIPSTGRNYNLEQNWWYDARRDIVASTNAALEYLQTLHQMFGDWHLALAAYNMGENGLARSIERNRVRGLPTDYQSVAMPNETRRYVPSLIALRDIVANPAAFGVDLDPIPNAPYFVTVTLTRDIELRVAAKLAEMPIEEFVALNPGHNRPVVASAVTPQLVLPADRADVFIRNLEQRTRPLSSWRVYTFRPTDRLDRLAAESGVSLAQLRAANGLGPKSKVAAGQQILLPEKGSAAANEALPPLFTPPASAAAPAKVARSTKSQQGSRAARTVKAPERGAATRIAQAGAGARAAKDAKAAPDVRTGKLAAKIAPGKPTAGAKGARAAAKTQPSGRPASPTQIARRS